MYSIGHAFAHSSAPVSDLEALADVQAQHGASDALWECLTTVLDDLEHDGARECDVLHTM